MSLRYRVVRKLGFLLRLRLEEPPGLFWRTAIDLLAWIVRLYGWTLRYKVTDEPNYFAGDINGAGIFLLWHNRIVAVPPFYERWRVRGRSQPFVLTSASPEGSLLARFLSHFGFGAVRGSTSRRASVALHAMAKLARQGHDVVLTPDGPRGPRYRLQPGALFLAQATGCPIIAIHLEYSRYVRFKSWDGFALPMPFARVTFRLGQPCFVAPTLTETEFERERQRIESLMKQSMVMDAPATAR